MNGQMDIMFVRVFILLRTMRHWLSNLINWLSGKGRNSLFQLPFPARREQSAKLKLWDKSAGTARAKEAARGHFRTISPYRYVLQQGFQQGGGEQGQGWKTLALDMPVLLCVKVQNTKGGMDLGLRKELGDDGHIRDSGQPGSRENGVLKTTCSQEAGKRGAQESQRRTGTQGGKGQSTLPLVVCRLSCGLSESESLGVRDPGIKVLKNWAGHDSHRSRRKCHVSRGRKCVRGESGQQWPVRENSQMPQRSQVKLGVKTGHQIWQLVDYLESLVRTNADCIRECIPFFLKKVKIFEFYKSFCCFLEMSWFLFYSIVVSHSPLRNVKPVSSSHVDVFLKSLLQIFFSFRSKMRFFCLFLFLLYC